MNGFADLRGEKLRRSIDKKQTICKFKIKGYNKGSKIEDGQLIGVKKISIMYLGKQPK